MYGDSKPHAALKNVVHPFLLDLHQILYQLGPEGHTKFSMAGNYGQLTRAKVSWGFITKPKERGGLGIVD